jgi:ComF family protein
MAASDAPKVSRWHAVKSAVLDLIFPRSCVHCRGVVENEPLQYLCEPCLKNVSFVSAPHCSTCGWPFPGRVEGARRCPNCEDLEPDFEQGRTGVLLEGVARTFVHELKYRRGTHLRADLQALVRRAQPLKHFVRGAVLVPVPLHPRRFRWRGFNQARWVADAFVAEGGAAGVAELLLRVRDTPTQTRLKREARAENMKGAFALRSGTELSSETRYIIVDDVFTTGATLNACAQVLRRAGAERLDAATLAHG